MRSLGLAATLLALMVLGPGASGGASGNYLGRVSVVLPVSASQFPAGEGADIANAQCLMCHSSGMVLSQPPQTAAQWTAVIAKMQKVYGAPIPEGQVAPLSAYLANVSSGAIGITNASEAPGARSAGVDGAAIFQARCAPCHQAAGTGLPGAFPPLAGSSWVTGSKTAAVEIVLRGVQGPLTVNNSPYAGVMPEFATQLNDQEIAAVLSYVRSQWGNTASLIDADLVKSLRAAGASRSGAWNGEADLKMLETKVP